MSLVFATEIIAASAVINALITLIVAKAILKATGINRLLPAVKQMYSMMGQHSQANRRDARQIILAKQGREKMTRAAIETLPMGNAIQKMIEKSGITPDELWATLQDENFIKGVKVIYSTFGSLFEKITGRGEEKKEEGSGGIMY